MENDAEPRRHDNNVRELVYIASCIPTLHLGSTKQNCDDGAKMDWSSLALRKASLMERWHELVKPPYSAPILKSLLHTVGNWSWKRAPLQLHVDAPLRLTPESLQTKKKRDGLMFFFYQEDTKTVGFVCVLYCKCCRLATERRNDIFHELLRSITWAVR